MKRFLVIFVCLVCASGCSAFTSRPAPWTKTDKALYVVAASFQFADVATAVDLERYYEARGEPYDEVNPLLPDVPTADLYYAWGGARAAGMLATAHYFRPGYRQAFLVVMGAIGGWFVIYNQGQR